MMAAESIQPAWRLSELLQDLVPVAPNQDVAVRGLAMDSRRVRHGDLFLACAGKHRHGLAFVMDAIRAGAVAIAWEPTPEVSCMPAVMGSKTVPALSITALGAKAGVIADRFFGHPSRDLFVVGVAGTDGKTSCSHFIAQVLGNRESPCGVLGTVGYGRFGELRPGPHTTPDAVTLHSYLADFREQGFGCAVLEVSSHALDQGRISGVAFDVALFTNLGRDHLDYHGDMQTYGRAKRRLFEQPGLPAAVLNIDDPFSREIFAVLSGGTRLIAYGLREIPDWARGGADVGWVLGRALQVDSTGIHMDIDSSWGKGRLASPLPGEFNAHNLLGTLGTALVGGVPLTVALERLSRVKAVPGRMECFTGKPGQPLVIVDYAHTPQALEHALLASRRVCRGALWCVFGAGGGRDPGKRPLMGACAEQYADRVIVTDDNPRREDPQQIVAEILSGMSDPDAVWIEHDRAAAIRHAVTGAVAGDVVLIAGKGHEAWQEIGDRRLPFDDRDQVATLFHRGRS